MFLACMYGTQREVTDAKAMAVKQTVFRPTKATFGRLQSALERVRGGVTYKNDCGLCGAGTASIINIVLNHLLVMT